MGSKEAMNMGSSDSNIVSNIKSLISLLGQETNRAVQTITAGIAKVGSYGVGPSGPGQSSTLVAPNPEFKSAPAITYVTETGNGTVASGPAAGNNIVARGPSTNLSDYVTTTGSGTVYRSESSGAGGGGGSTGGTTFGGGRGGNTSATSASQQGWANIPGIGTVISAAFGAYNVGANLTPNTSDVLEAQLLQQRASFYTGANSKLVTNTNKLTIGDIQDAQKTLAGLAMLGGDNPQMDVIRAQVAAQGLGLGSSMSGLMKSAANVSNLMPGLGVEGSIRATGSMQQAYNVNMLRGIGIQLRTPGGGLKGPDEVINEVWDKICRDYGQAYGAGKKPSLNEVQISLQPGNALDSMLNTYFGNDPMLKQLVANGLIYKAQGGAAINKGGVEALGGFTPAMTSYTETAAAGQAYLVASEGAAASGFDRGNTAIRTFYKTAANSILQTMMGIKAYTDTILTAFGGNPLSSIVGAGGASAVSAFGATMDATRFLDLSPTDAIKALFSSFFSNLGFKDFKPTDDIKALFSSVFSNLGFKAEGGAVSSNTPYIVGEKGPELFIPDNSGTVVPNSKLASGNYTYNFTINAPSGNAQDLAAEIKNILVQIETSKRVSES